jgi:hypothetical protein
MFLITERVKKVSYDYKKQIFINSVLCFANVDGNEDRTFFFHGSLENVDYFTYARLVQGA